MAMTHDELQNNSSDTGTKVPMTHDELLATIEELRFNCGLDHSDPNTDALRAIVELKYEGWELVKDVTYPIGKKDLPEFYFKLGQLFAKDQIMQVIAKELE